MRIILSLGRVVSLIDTKSICILIDYLVDFIVSELRIAEKSLDSRPKSQVLVATDLGPYFLFFT